MDDSRSVAVLPPAAGYDLIGDVHGCGVTLSRLLERMGYRRQGEVYRHANRRAVFVGDVIDRGPRVREALQIVKAMVDAGEAVMVIGNHEFNALTYCTPRPDGEGYLRPHVPRTNRQIAETLEQFAHYPAEWREYLAWFARLPIFIEYPGHKGFSAFRVVHACWDAPLIAHHLGRYGSGHFDEQFLLASVEPQTIEYKTRQRLTSGIDLPLPGGMSIISSDGYERSSFRTKFWADNPRTYGDLLFQPDPLPDSVANAPISDADRACMTHYGPEQPPLFVGHYWLKGKPSPLAPNLACLDYSAVKYGRLVAYRMDGEAHLAAHKFVWEYVDP